MAQQKTASEMMESPDVCPFCEADEMDVDVDNDGEGYCCECQRTWKVERRLVGYSYTDKDGEYHEVTEEPGDRIAALEEQVRILREALGEIAGTSASEAPGESLLEHLQAGEDAENSLADIQGIVHRALEATKEKP